MPSPLCLSLSSAFAGGGRISPSDPTTDNSRKPFPVVATCPSLQNYRPSGVVGPRRCASYATYRPGYGSAVLYLRQAKAHTAPGEDLHDDQP